MKQLIDKFVHYLRFERNASPNTIREYRRDLMDFQAFLTPPGEKTLPLARVDHRTIREFVSWLYDRKQKSPRWRADWRRCDLSSNSACAKNSRNRIRRGS